MKTRKENWDILAELYQGKISLDRAYDCFDEVFDSADAGDIESILSLSHVEYTAFGHGVPLDIVANWRFEGWPKLCAECGRPTNPNDFGWFAKEKDGGWVLYHVSCLPSGT